MVILYKIIIANNFTIVLLNLWDKYILSIFIITAKNKNTNEFNNIISVYSESYKIPIISAIRKYMFSFFS